MSKEMEKFDPNDYMSIEDYAKLYKITKTTAYRHHWKGLLNSIKFTGSRKIWVNKNLPLKTMEMSKTVVYGCNIKSDGIVVEYNDSIKKDIYEKKILC